MAINIGISMCSPGRHAASLDTEESDDEFTYSYSRIKHNKVDQISTFAGQICMNREDKITEFE